MMYIINTLNKRSAMRRKPILTKAEFQQLNSLYGRDAVIWLDLKIAEAETRLDGLETIRKTFFKEDVHE